MFTVSFEDKYNGYRGHVTAVTFSPVNFGETTPEKDTELLAHTFAQFQQIVHEYHQSIDSNQFLLEDWESMRGEVREKETELREIAVQLELANLARCVHFERIGGAFQLYPHCYGSLTNDKPLDTCYVWLHIMAVPDDIDQTLDKALRYFHGKGWRWLGHGEIVRIDDEAPF